MTRHYPVRKNSRITSNFGWRIHPITGRKKLHYGTDFAPHIAGSRGQPVYAIKSGKVVTKGHNNARGHYIIIKHTGENVSSLYQHLDSTSVSKGQTVKGGSQIGVMGTSGSSTGVHLHLELFKGAFTRNPGVYIDPIPYLKGGDTMGQIKEDGSFGPATIKRLQEFLGTKQDGKLSKPKSNMVLELQKFLNKYGQ